MRRQRDRGATLVEAALVFPILMLIVVGILELGMAFKDFLTVSYLSREGARIGALAGNDDIADCAILTGIGDLATAKDLDRITEIQIFKAAEGTGAAVLTNTAHYVVGRDPSICSVPSNPAVDAWTFEAPIEWAPTSRQVKVGVNDLDIIGVRILLDRDWVTGFPPFNGPTMTVDESTITRLEPKVFES